MLNSGRLFTGGLLLLAGVLLLLNNIGVIGWGLWINLLSLWPLLLVALGLRLIFRRGPLAILSPLVLVLMVVWAIAMPAQYVPGSETSTFRQTLDPTVREATLVIGTGAVDLRVRASDMTSGDLFSASERWFGRPTVWRYELINYRAVVRATRRFDTIVGIPFTTKGMTNRSEIALHPSVPWRIEVNSGASNVDLDLAGIEVRELEIGSGASNIDIVLGDRAERVVVEIEAGFASVDLTVPRGVGVRVDKESALSGDNLSAMGFSKQNDMWFSRGYESATKFIEVNFEGGFSSFNIHFSGASGTTL
jgi:hypothetical protein